MRQLSRAVRLFLKWSYIPFDRCQCLRHDFIDVKGKHRPLPDIMVCEREQAWREYVIERDKELNEKN